MSKEGFLNKLKEEGYTAGFYNNGIPTVFITDSAEIGDVNRLINQIRRECGYTQSYGISLMPAGCKNATENTSLQPA